jgi:hypothetical protein
MKSKPCIRCTINPGEYLWNAASGPAAKVYPELRLCKACCDALRNTIINGQRKAAAKTAAAEPVPVPAPQAVPEPVPVAAVPPVVPVPAPAPPPAAPSRADGVPVRNSLPVRRARP